MTEGTFLNSTLGPPHPSAGIHLVLGPFPIPAGYSLEFLDISFCWDRKWPFLLLLQPLQGLLTW